MLIDLHHSDLNDSKTARLVGLYSFELASIFK